jgi:hypothetical protein
MTRICTLEESISLIAIEDVNSERDNETQDLLVDLAEQGDAEAQFELEQRYMDGDIGDIKNLTLSPEVVPKGSSARKRGP